jgi:hypothetical protein
MNLHYNPAVIILLPMQSRPVRFSFQALLVFLLAIAGSQSIAQPGEASRDSLYTYAYFKHRLHLCEQRFTIPRFEHRRMRAVASVADSLAGRWSADVGGPDAYLPYWAAHPELNEAAARAKFGLEQPPQAACLTDTSGYAASRRRFVARKLGIYHKQRSRDTLAVLALLDTIGREFGYTDAVMQAKRLAIAVQDTGAYRRTLRLSGYPSFAEARRNELRWPVATTAEQRAFVGACLETTDSNTVPGVNPEPQALRHLMTRFADFQNLCSESILVGRTSPLFLQPHKRKRRRIYCFIAEETYTVMPGQICRYLSTPVRFSRTTLSELDYLSLHLMQLNSYGQIYPDSLFENYLSFIRQLAFAGKEDMEAYAALRDEYLTKIKGRPSEYGYNMRGLGPEDKPGYVPSTAVRDRRESEGLVPLEVVAAETK